MENEFLYTNAGISIVDGSDDYGVKKFFNYRFGEKIDPHISEQIQSLEKFLLSWNHHLEKPDQRAVIVGQAHQNIQIIISTYSQFSKEKRGEAQRENFLVRGVVLAKKDWQNSECQWKILLGNIPNNDMKMTSSNLKTIHEILCQNTKLEECLPQIHFLIPELPSRKSLLTFKTITLLIVFCLLLVMGIYQFISNPLNSSERVEKQKHLINKEEEIQSLEPPKDRLEAKIKRKWLQRLEQRRRLQILSKNIRKKIEKIERSSQSRFLHLTQKNDMLFMPDNIDKLLAHLHSKLQQEAFAQWKITIQNAISTVDGYLQQFSPAQYIGMRLKVYENLSIKEKKEIQQFLKDFELNLVLVVDLIQLIEPKKYQSIKKELNQ